MSICTDLQSSYSLEEILHRRYRQRENLIQKMGFISSMRREEYPNLDFISYFGKYIYLGDTANPIDCLCHLEKSPLKIDRIFGQGKMGKAYRIIFNEKEYIIKIISGVQYKSYLSVVIHSISEINPAHMQAEPSIEYNMIRSQTGSLNIVAVEQDQFQNQTMINLILPEILQKGYVQQLDAYYCRNDQTRSYDGYNIMQIANLGDVSTLLESRSREGLELSDRFVMEMLGQILEPLSILKSNKYGFCHNDLKTRNIFVSGTLQNPVFLLADFDKSSIFWNKLRFCNTLRPSSIFASKGLQYYYSGYPVDKGYYKLNKEKVLGENSGLIMYSWIPMFMSHDIYTLIVSLLLEPLFWISFSSGEYPQFKQLLLFMFEDQMDMLLSEIEEMQYQYEVSNPQSKREMLKSFYSMNNINHILSGYRLKIDLSQIYNMFELQIQEFQELEREQMHQSKDRHVCTSPCNKTCETNTYSKTSWLGTITLQHSDSC